MSKPTGDDTYGKPARTRKSGLGDTGDKKLFDVLSLRVIALIEDPGVVRRILQHLGLWAPLATKHSPPRLALL